MTSGIAIPVEESFTKWRGDPEYVKAYDALENEFAVAAAAIDVRARADFSRLALGGNE